MNKIDATKQYLYIDLYTKHSRILNHNEIAGSIRGCRIRKGARRVWHSEEHMVVEL